MSDVSTACHAPWTTVSTLVLPAALRSFGSLRRAFATMVTFRVTYEKRNSSVRCEYQIRNPIRDRGRTPKQCASVPEVLAFNPIPLMLVPISGFTG